VAKTEVGKGFTTVERILAEQSQRQTRRTGPKKGKWQRLLNSYSITGKGEKRNFPIGPGQEFFPKIGEGMENTQVEKKKKEKGQRGQSSSSR